MDVVECTRFPNLYPENFDPENIVTVEREINDFPATQDQLYRAWASVLKAYTGEEEPVFLSNGDIVRVKPDRWTIETVKEIHSQQKPRHSDTAIFTNSSATVYCLALKLEYNPETLSGCLLSSGHVPLEQLESIEAHLRVAVTWFSQQSKGDVPLSKLSALPASILNPNPVSFPGPDLLHHLCSDHSPREQPAIDFHGADHRHATVTFEELDHHSLNLAIQIYKSIGKSTGPSAPTIAILMQQCPELYISQLAVLKTGCAFCSINLDAPEERLQFILEDVSAPVILTTSKLAERIPASCDIKIIVVDDAIGESLSSQGTYQVFPARGSDLAYVMYTSGSTGKPKGVPVSHRAVTQSLLAHEKHIPRFSRFLQFAAPTFDVSIFEIFFTFFRGSTLVVCDRSVLLNDLPGTMNQLQIDAAELTPTVAGALLQRRNSVLGLKLLLTIGEMLTRPVVEEFGGDENRDSILWAMYGPTEAAIHCTIQPAFSTSSKVGNIGRPFDSVSAFIISPADETARWSDIDVLPLGFVGELAIGGCQLADGYLNRTEQTTAAFNDHPQLGQLYRTGDRARILQNGTIECLGRTSTGQIKLRGQRIELGEIEQTATRISGCKIAVASVIAGTLVLFCCVDPDVLVDKVKIISQKWLPAFMVPGDFVLLPKFPYLASGKVDKTRLEQQYLESRDTPSNESMEDTDASSRQIYDILQKAVGHGFPANARLAAVGLDSLLAIKTASRLRLIGYDVSPMDLLRFDTIADFQELRGSIAQKGMAQKGQCESPTPEVIRTLLERDKDLRKLLPGIETVIPCTPLQIAMLAETNTNPRAYCNWIEIECRKAASQLEIKSWLRQIVAGNEILRTGFAEISSSEHQYVQIIWKTFPNDGFTEVSRFSRDFDFQNDSSLLHPIHIQLCFDGRHHRILIQLHHALYDGWSVDLILKDLNTLATKSELQSRPQFRKVEKYYRNISNERSKEFWEDQLGSYAPAPLPQLISDHRDDDSVSSSTFKFSLSLGEVKSGCRALEISPQSVFQAALTYIISAYAGTHDVAIAVVTSGRTIPVDEIESVIGPCMATVPLRVKINHSRSVKDLLGNIHSLNRQILDHSGVSFRDIQRSVGFDQELTLCDVLFVWQESLESHHNEDAAFNLVASSDQLEFKLTMEVEPRGHDVFGKATYFNSSLSKTQIQFLFKQLDELVIHFLRTTNCLIEDIPIAMTPEVGSILNPNPELETFEDGLVELIDRVSLDHPDRNAVLFVDSAMATKTRYQILTYRELNERANQISHLLRDRVRDEDELVCICMEKSIDLYVAILGVLKSGRGYLPITPQTPVERIRGILKESGIAFCLSHGETSRDLGLDANIVVTNIEEVDFSELSVNTVPARRDGQLAYAMFTSGSTGAPKGVLVTEQNLLSNLKVLAEIYPTCENPRLLQACSQAFDVSAFEIFYAWFSGMCLCSMSNDVLFQDLEHAIRELEITHLSLTPTVAALIHPDNVPTVRFLVTAGEAVTEHVMKLWAGRGLFQGYGPSETTNICTVNPDFQHMNLIHDVGFPLRNTSAFVLEPSSQNIVLRGGLGELCFGGDQVFRGYLNRDDLTAEKVIIHEAYGKIYRSGDLGRILPSGAIECIGRIDDQLKIRGQRVELGEINRTLLKDENILDCVTLVIGIESTNADTLVSFYVPSGCETTDILIRETDDATRALIQRAFNLLESTLPDYMIPLHLLPISAIPQTSQGKVDKRRLITAFRELGREYLETVTRSSDDFKGDDNWTTAEWQIREAVAAVMKVPVSQLRKHASFFGLGLDSISAISVSRLLRENGFSITVSMILKNPSISRLVRSLSADSDQELSKLPTVFTKEELEQVTQKLGEEGMRIVKVLPCTPLQEAMLSASQAHGPNAYCNLMLFRITGDASRLHEAWDMVRRRHEIFQTAFFHTENMAFPVAQVVLQGPPKIWNSEPEEYRVTDSEALLDLLVKDANDQIARLLQENRPPYNLRMLRFEDDTYIQFACHHTLYDGYAIQRLILEVEAQYNKKAFEEPPSPDDFLKIVASTRNEIATTFWVIKLQSLKPILLRARIGASRGIWKHYLDLPLSVMEAACQTSSTSLLSLVQAALAKSLAYLLQSNDVCFGNVVSGRTFPVDGLDRLVFPTFNTIPVRANLTRTRSNIELLTTLQEWNAASQDFQLVPLRLIQGHLGFGRSGLFSALLLLQPGLYELDPEIWELKADVGNMDIPLIFELIPDRLRNSISLRLHYNTSIISSNEASALSRLFNSSLLSCVQYPASFASDFHIDHEEEIFSVRKHIYYPDSDLPGSGKETENGNFTPVEAQMRSLLSDFSKIPKSRIKTETTIYQLGLDSISAVQLANTLRLRTGKKITAADILERPTLAALSELLNDEQQFETDERNPEIDFSRFENQVKSEVCTELNLDLQDVEAIRPCTPLQTGLISQFLRSGTMYLNHVSVLLDRSFEVDTIQKSWKVLMSSNIMLRTGFAPVNHPEHSFVMITHYHPEPTTFIQTGHAHQDISQWRQECTYQIHREIHHPPWRVLLLESKDGPIMHLTILHALYDAHSLRLMLQDLTSFCNTVKTLDHSPIDPLLGTILSGQQSGEDFWKNELGQASINKFPNLTPLRRSDNQTEVVHRLTSKSMTGLERGCREAGITLQAAGQAACVRILSAYLGEHAVTFGVVLSGRDTTTEAEDTVFPCITTVPVAVENISDGRKLIENIMGYNGRVRRFQYSSMRNIQRWIGRPNETLFDTIFAYQKLSGHKSEDPWTVIEEIATDEYSLSLELEPTGSDELKIRATFKSDIIPEGQVRILLNQFDAILCQLIFSAESELSLDLSENLFSVIPPKCAELASPVTLLHQFVELAANRTPLAIAYEFVTQIRSSGIDKRTWTYSQLNEQGNRAAALLQRNGIQPGVLVAICFDKCPEASFAILGILKAGCAYVALDPGAPFERKKFIIEDSGAKIILTADRKSGVLWNHDDAFDKIAISSIYLDEELQTMANAEVLPVRILPKHLCYCLYTSGTTGTPKGCEITHENAVQAMRAFSILFDGHWNSNSKWLQFASFHFDVSVLEQFWSWSERIRVISAPRDVIFEDLAGTIRALDITHIDLTPSLAVLLHPDEVPSLCRGVFITGGEALRQEILDVWGPQNVIYNGYGPTEATIGVTMYTRVPKNGQPSNIGEQFENVGTSVLEPNTETLVLRGAVGELCVSGKLVGRGYLGRPDLTEKKFLTLEKFGERVYRTGDLVRLLHNGCFQFLGRADDQVKLRGQRLEMGEINSIVKRTEGIIDVSTYVLKHPQQQKEQLVTFVVPKHDMNNTDESVVQLTPGLISVVGKVFENCRARLPPYMVPTHVIPINVLPLSANNKVDVVRLKYLFTTLSPDDLQTIGRAGTSSRSDLNTVEEQVANILAQGFNIPLVDIRPSSSIFELGLDSITVMRFARALKVEGFCLASPSIIMKNATIASLSNAISSKSISRSSLGALILAKQVITATAHKHKSTAARILQVSLAEIEGVAPCTPLQAGMISRSMSGDTAYFATFCFELKEGVDILRLKSAWAEAFQRIQILRTRFVRTSDGYIQGVTKAKAMPWFAFAFDTQEKLEWKIKLASAKKRWQQKNNDHILHPIEILQFCLPESSTLVLNIFHGLYDGISLPLLLQRVHSLYHAETPTDFGPPFLSVLPYGPLGKVSGAREFWKKHLTSSSTDLPRFSSSGMDVVIASARLDDLSQFDQIRKRLNTTHQSIVQACWSAVLHQHCHGLITMGLVVSGRSIEHDFAESVIGPMFNTIPFLLHLNGSDSWSSIIERCHAFNIEMLPFQHSPLRDITKWCGNMGKTRELFQNLFVFQRREDGVESYSDNDLWKMWEGPASAVYPLSFESELLHDGILNTLLVAQSEYADQETAHRLLANFSKAIRDVLRDPSMNIRDSLGYVGGSEKSSSEAPQVPTPASNGPAVHFQWTEAAMIIRKEMASLASVDEDKVTPTTSIFELGLDSIDAIKLSSRLGKLQMNVPVSTIMKYPSISKLLEIVSVTPMSANSNVRHTLTDIETKLKRSLSESHHLPGAKRYLPATPLQEGMVIEMLNSKFKRYYNHDIFKIGEWVDISKLKTAWSDIIAHNPILRTTFFLVDDPSLETAVAQVVIDPSALEWNELNIAEQDEIPGTLKRIAEHAFQQPMGSTNVKLTLFRTHGDCYLVLSIPHALYDGWSLQLLHQDVQRAYHGQITRRPSYALVLEEIISGSSADAEDFWSGFLSDSPSTLISQYSNVKNHQSEVLRCEISSKKSAEFIKSFCRSESITMQAIGQACWTLVLASYVRSLEVVYGVVLSGRDSEESREVQFPTMNTVAFRSIIHGSRRDLLQFTQDDMSSIRQYQHFPLRRAQALASRSGQKLFDTLFIYQMQPEASETTTKPLYESVGGAFEVEFPVCVEAETVGDQFIWRTACKSSAMDEEGAMLLLQRLDDTLSGIMEKPEIDCFQFDKDSVRICDLPPFQLAELTTAIDDSGETALPELNERELSKVEMTIRSVLSSVSRTPEDEISRSSSIFHLGLDSISAIKVSSLLGKQGIHLRVSEMLQNPTLSGMARLFQTQSERTPTTYNSRDDNMLKISNLNIDALAILGKFDIAEYNVECILPASAGQIYFLTAWQNASGGIFYSQFRYHFRGVSREGIQKAWSRLVQRNQILRTMFAITLDAKIPLVQIVLKKTEESILFDHDKDNIKWKFAQPFVELRAIRIDLESWDVVLKIHHALYDGVSLPLLMSQFERLLQQDFVRTSIDNEDTTFRQLVTQPHLVESINHAKTFWKQYLQGAPKVQRLGKPSGLSYDKRFEIFIPGFIPSVADLTRRAKSVGTSLQALVLAAYAHTYPALVVPPPLERSNQNVVIGVYLANRSQDIDGLVTSPSPTVNLVSLNVKAINRVSFATTAASIQSDLAQIGIAAHANTGLWQIKEWTGVQIDTFVNFLTLPAEDRNSPEDTLKIEEVKDDISQARENVSSTNPALFVAPKELRDNPVRDAYLHSIDLELAVKDGSLDVGLFGPTQLLSLADAQRFLRDFKKSLAKAESETD